MTEVTTYLCWDQNFVPKGILAPAPRLYTCIKSWKKLYKIRLQRDFFLNLWQMTKVTRGFCWHQNFVPWGCLPLTCGYILSNDDPGLALTIFMTGSNLFLMLLYGWQRIDHLVLLYSQVYSNSAYPQHSGERYRTSGPLVIISEEHYDDYYTVYVP